MAKGLSEVCVGDTNQCQCSKQGLSPKKETCDDAQQACLVCGRMWAEDPSTIQIRISREIRRFPRMVISSSAVDLL